MKTKAKELHGICKKDKYKEYLKVMSIPMLAILLLLGSFIIFFLINKVIIGVYIFGASIIISMITFVVMMPVIVNIPFKEICVDNMNIGVFVEPSIGSESRFITIHLIVDGKEYTKSEGLEYYHHGANNLVGLAVNASEFVRYLNDYKKDKNQNTHIVRLTKKVKNKSISAFYDKYTRGIIIAVDSKLYN